MTPQEKANNLVNTFRMIFMNADTECGEEILCTILAKQCAEIAVEEIILAIDWQDNQEAIYYWNEVLTEIENI
jgi:hypothetical protein